MTTREAVLAVLKVTKWITSRDFTEVYRCFVEQGLVPDRVPSGLRARLAELASEPSVASGEKAQKDGTVVTEYYGTVGKVELPWR